MNPYLKLVFVSQSLFLAACGYNTKVIDTYQQSANSITSDFMTISNNTVAICRQNHELGAVESTTWVSGKDAIDSAKKDCAPMEEEIKSINLAATVISAYASSLALLAGVDPNYIDDDLSGLSDVAGKLKNTKGNEKISKEKLDALSKLASLISQVVTSEAVKSKMISTIQENKETINESVLVLKTFTNEIYSENVQISDRYTEAMLVRLNKESVSGEPADSESVNKKSEQLNKKIPYRLAQREFVQLQQVSSSNKAAAKKFSEAADQFITANNDLADKFETLDKNAQLQSVKDLAKKAKELRESIKKINEG